jgi:putative membrane protein
MSFLEILLRWAIFSIALLLISRFVPGFTVESFYTALVVSAILGFLNVFIRPILVLLTLPITLLTLGLFSFVINAGLLLFAASFIKGFSISGFFPALVAAALLWLVGFAMNLFTKEA